MPTPDQVRAAINALYRVRAVEKPASPDGTREVWHQAALGVDLLSVVDAEGKLTQQELTLFAEVIHWSRRGGLRSGKLADPASTEPISGDGKRFDPALSPVRVARANDALSGYQGSDNYLLHLRDLLAAASTGQAFNDGRVVSGALPGDSQRIVIPQMHQKPRHAVVLAIGAVLVIAAAGAWFFFR